MSGEAVSSTGPATRRLDGATAWVAGCVLLHVVLAALVFEPILFTGADASHYMVLGESLRSGAGYRDLYLPGSPLHAKFPPGYPLLLAVLGWFGGLQLFKVASVALTAGCVWLTFRLGRRFGDSVAVVAAALFALSPVLLQFSHLVLSEALFTFLLLLTLVSWSERRRSWLPLGLATAAFFTRTAGLAVLLAVPLFAWLRGSRKRAVVGALVAIAAIGGWAVYQRLATPAEAGYLQQLWMVNPYNPELGRVGAGGLLSRAGSNLWTYASRELPGSFGFAVPRPGTVPLLTALVGVGLTLSATAGWLRDIGERLTPGSVVTLLYVGLIVLWPDVWTDRRFLLPVLPLLLVYALDGIVAVARRFAGGRIAGVLAVGALLAVPAALSTARLVPERVACQVSYRHGKPCYLPEYASFYALAEWTRDHTAPDAIVVNRNPPAFYLISRRRGDVYPYSRDPEVVLRGLEEIGADYVVVGGLSVTTLLYLVPTIEEHPERFEFVHAEGNPAALLFRLLPAQRTAAADGRSR